MDGIFFDEVTDSCAVTTQPAYYRQLFDYVKAKPGDIDRVVLNPGAKVGDCYMSASDIIVTFENTYANYVNWQPSGWESTQPANHFWHLITETSQADMSNAISLAKSRNAGWVYVTDDSGANPWDSLPSYWSSELPLVSGA